MPTYLGPGKRIVDPSGTVPDMYHNTSFDRLFDLLNQEPVDRYREADSNLILDAYMAKLAYDEIPSHIVDTVEEGMGILLARKMLNFRFLLDNP